MAEPKAKVGNCHDAPASTPSGVKVNDRAVSYEGRFQIRYVVESIMDFGRRLNNATTGWIESDAEPGFRKHSVSGWRRGTGSSEIMDCEVYCTRVRKVAKDIEFYIPKDRLDNRREKALPHHKGRFRACHVEKFLAVWWLEKVLFFCFRTKDLSRMHELRGIKLPARMARATVVLNHEPCDIVGGCLQFLDEIHRITGIKISTRQIPFLAPFEREGVEEYPYHEQSESEGDKEDVEEVRPETPRPPVARKASNPEASKELAYSSPPQTWEVFLGCAVPCAKPLRHTKVTLDNMPKLDGGQVSTSQSTTTSQPPQDESRSGHGNAGLSEPSLQSEDETMTDAENDRRFSESSSMSPFPGARNWQSISSSRLEVHLPYISPEIRPQYRRIESDDEAPRQPSLSGQSEPSSPAPIIENTTTTPPRRLPNLNRFNYGGGMVTPAKRPARERTRKPKGPTRAERMRKKSTFLKAATRATLQRGQVREELGRRDRQSVPDSGTGDDGPDDDDDEDVSMVPVSGTGGGGTDDADEDVPMVHPSFMEEYGLDVVMG